MIAIIGGTGVYQIEGLKVEQEMEVKTPFGETSAPLTMASLGDKKVVFLARHGKNHHLLPHEVNYRANIWALKSVGVRQAVGISAVGSLRENLAPGDFAIASQYFDFIKGAREKSFFGGGLAAHVSTAEPTCPQLISKIAATTKKLGMTLHTGVTYGCVDGPRLGTRAESNFLRNSAQCDLVGMTNVPEVFLAREAQICYCTIGIVTDYDCWLDDPEQHVTAVEVIARYGESIERAKRLILEFLQSPPPKIDPGHREVLQHAVLTPREALSAEKRELLELLEQ